MQLTRRLLLIGASLVCAGIVSAAPPPLNLSRAKEAVRDYHDSGQYAADVQQVAEWAMAWVEQRVATAEEGERLAMVFDIDETVLSNYPHMDEQDFGYVPHVWEAWVDQAAAAAIEPVKAVYLKARELGVAVIFLTGRGEPAERAGTIKNLEAQGMGEYERLILRGPRDTAPTAAERKRLRREQLEAEGWTIIASIGDQGSDLAGGHAERIFKLPNPFYLVP